MKKTLLAALLTSQVLCTTSAFATGIPVYDAIGVAKTVQEGLTRAQEAKAALDQAVREYEQAKRFGEDTKRRFEGISDFSHGFDTVSSYMQDSLSKITEKSGSNLETMRQEHNLRSEDAKTQEKYDQLLKKIAFYDNFNKAVSDRAKRLESLQSDLRSADTPQKKSDLANQLAMEQMTLDMQIKQYDLAEKQFAEMDKVREEKERREFFKMTLGR